MATTLLLAPVRAELDRDPLNPVARDLECFATGCNLQDTQLMLPSDLTFVGAPSRRSSIVISPNIIDVLAQELSNFHQPAEAAPHKTNLEVLSETTLPETIATLDSDQLPVSYLHQPKKITLLPRWLSSIRHRSSTLTEASYLHQIPSHTSDDMQCSKEDDGSMKDSVEKAHEFVSNSVRTKCSTAGSSSSINLITGVKTASVSYASLSYKSSFRFSKRSSRFGYFGKRTAPKLDEATTDRMRRRRKIIEEFLITEEVYISELKTLLSIYLGSTCDDFFNSISEKESLRVTIGEILELHERLIQSMQHAVPFSFGANPALLRPWDQAPQDTGQGAQPITAASLAKAFDETMQNLCAYEQYISKYDALLRASGGLKCTGHRRSWERDCEILSNSLVSIGSRSLHGRRALTLEDLLMKPIQRICKYPLFLADLLRVTPVIDSPDSNAILEGVLDRLKQRIYQIDKAREDIPKLQETLERTSILQERLKFSHGTLFNVCLLGPIILCGALYVVWKESTIHGEYLACLLYKSHLLLTTISKYDPDLNVIIAIPLTRARIQGASQGKALVCRDTPFTWKVTFDQENRTYELIFSAWSAKEESVWRKALEEGILFDCEDSYTGEPSVQWLPFPPALMCDIEPSYKLPMNVNSENELLSLRGPDNISTESASTVVTLRNTFSTSESIGTWRSASSSTDKTSSVPNTERFIILSPKRNERARVESALADVWTKDELPMSSPLGTNGQWGEWKVIRKLSKPSFTRKPRQCYSFTEGYQMTKEFEPDSPGSDAKIRSEKRRSNSLAMRSTKSMRKPSEQAPDVCKPESPKSPSKPSTDASSFFSNKLRSAINSTVTGSSPPTLKKKRWGGSDSIGFLSMNIKLPWNN